MKDHPPKPDNLRGYNCDITIFNQKFTKLEISPDYEVKNQEYLKGLAKKGIKPSQEELAKVLISDQLIINLVKQLSKERKIKYEGKYYQYTYYTYEPLFNQHSYAYRLVWCCDTNNPTTLGIIDCYWRSKYNQIE